MNLRRAVAALPVFLLALLVQLYAPAGSSLAIGRMQNAAVTVSAPCSEHARHAAKGAPHSPGACCDLCEFVFSGAAPVVLDLPPSLARPVAFHRIAWSLPVGRIVAPSRGGFAQARAPPFTS